MKLTASEKRTLTLVSVALVLLLGWAFVISPWLQGRQLSQTGDSLTNETDAAKVLLAQAAAIRRRHAELAKAVAAVETHFLAETEAGMGRIALLTLVQRTAEAAGLTLSTLDPAGEGVPLPKIAVAVSGTGDPAMVERFLQGLRRSQIRLSVERLVISTGEGNKLYMRAVIATYLPKLEGGGSSE